MKIKLRQENEYDHAAVTDLIIDAFRGIPYSDNREQFLVERLRKSSSFIPQLSIIAEDGKGQLAGHILFTKIFIQNKDQSWPGLILAPLSIRPVYQNQGIGSKLVIEGHLLARALGHNYCVVFGHAKYYPKFGYRQLNNYPIRSPLKIPDENSMIFPLVKEGLSGITGTVKLPKEFLE